MQRGIKKHQKNPIADVTRLELKIKIATMAGWHVPNEPWRFILRRIRYEEVRVETPTEPRFARYLVVSKVPYCGTPRETGVSVESVSQPFNRVGNEHARDGDSADEKRWRQTRLLANHQDQRR